MSSLKLKSNTSLICCSYIKDAIENGHLECAEREYISLQDFWIKYDDPQSDACYDLFSNLVAVIEKHDVDMLDLLLRKTDERYNVLIASDDENNTLLHHATKNSDPFIFKLLLKNGANIMAKNILGDTVLHEAAYNGCLEILDIITQSREFKAQDNINLKNKEGKSALFYACLGDNLGCVELLLKNGAKKDFDIDQFSEEVEELFRRIGIQELNT